VNFNITDLPARKNYTGDYVVEDLAAGKHYKIETSPGGVDILDFEVPAGKKATIAVVVIIDVSDV